MVQWQVNLEARVRLVAPVQNTTLAIGVITGMPGDDTHNSVPVVHPYEFRWRVSRFPSMSCSGKLKKKI